MRRIFSDARRPVHAGPYPCEDLSRAAAMPDLEAVPLGPALRFDRPANPHSIVNAMRDHQTTLDAIRDGNVNAAVADVPGDPIERARHLKSFAYFCDAAGAGVCTIPAAARLAVPQRNPDLDRLAHDLARGGGKSFASGIDTILADLKDTLDQPFSGIDGQTHAVVLLYENPRAPDRDEPGCGWIGDAQAYRGALLASETAVVLASYLRLLGYAARAHTASSSDVDLGRMAVAAGLVTAEQGGLTHPYIGTDFGLAVVTTDFELATDAPLVPLARQPASAFGLRWRTGYGLGKRAGAAKPYGARQFRDGAHPFERLRRVDTPTTYIDEPNVARVPKRADMFARALFGDMGKALQEGAKGGHYVRKCAPSFAQRRALGAFSLLQDGPVAPERVSIAPQDAADLVKATAYWLGADAVGISRCPDWTWYSHDARGEPIEPPHDQAISMIIDQGYETMEGASGDDWISVAQSMRAYLRFSLIGGVVAAQLRRLGYAAKAHTVIDGEVLQPPLLLLSGLGEVSRIGEVILNPYLGPRLKSGVVTTDLPMAHDRPIDFGLQRFCESCNKCARECPSGAITAGPKLMFNGYEIWKSDSQKCASYRIGTDGGSMCGRCMKTCPWNLEGVFKEAPFRWAAMNMPRLAPALARLDDAVGNGGINPVKKWWWDIELAEDGAYRPAAAPVNRRDLQPDFDLRYADQTLAVYPAPLAPPPWPYPFPMDRERGIEAYQAMITAEQYRDRAARGHPPQHVYRVPDDPPVIEVEITRAEALTSDITAFEFRAPDGGDLPAWTAGAHVDIVVAPEYLRPYSLLGDPADRTRYRIAVLREEHGRGGSQLLHRIFNAGRRVFISKPINHFPLHPAPFSLLMGGGIGITPMIAMAHQLHAEGRDFALHYSGRTRADMGFVTELAAMPWAARVTLHVSDAGSRADLRNIMRGLPPDAHVYTCGGAPYMQAVVAAGQAAGLPEDALHLEYFTVPESPAFENHAFTLRLAGSGKDLQVPADRSAADVLIENGIHVDIKCADGICGVCKCGIREGAVEHRDFVLSKAQRETQMILCQSRAAQKDGVVVIDL